MAGKKYVGSPAAIRECLKSSLSSGGICPICSKVIQFGRGIFDCGDAEFVPYDDQAPSMDRIDCSRGYIEGNLRVVHRKCNSMRGDRDHTTFTYENPLWTPSESEIHTINMENDSILKSDFRVDKLSIQPIQTKNTYMKPNKNMDSDLIREMCKTSSDEQLTEHIRALQEEQSSRQRLTDTVAKLEDVVKQYGWSNFDEFVEAYNEKTSKPSTKPKSKAYRPSDMAVKRIFSALTSSGIKTGDILVGTDKRWNVASKEYNQKGKVEYFKSLVGELVTQKMIPIIRVRKGEYLVESVSF